MIGWQYTEALQHNFNDIVVWTSVLKAVRRTPSKVGRLDA